MQNSTHNTLPLDMSGLTIHFTGIKGTGMTALVEICKGRGATIQGSDVEDIFYTDEILAKLGITVSLFSKNNITNTIDMIIYSSAYDPLSHCELVEATKQGIPMVEYSEALGALSASSYSCGIAGVHGKTTTTGMTGTILKSLDLKSQVLAGSLITSFGNTCTMNKGSDIFVAETCEYKRHFLHFHPNMIVLTSIESDHQDYYPHYEDILHAFLEYIEKLPKGGTLIFCADEKGACEAATIMQKNRSDIVYLPYGSKVGDFPHLSQTYGLKNKRIEREKQTFNLNGFDNDFSLIIPGHHNVLNACAAIAVCCELIKTKRALDKNDMKNVRDSLLSFVGSKRRGEIIGKTKNPDVIFIDDYGHHPTAVKTTLEGFRSFYPDRILIADFMSHTYSRTFALLDDFSQSFTAADEVILHKIYSSAREKKEDFEGKVSGRILYEKAEKFCKKIEYFEEIMDAKNYVLTRLCKPVQTDKKGYVFVTMGAGDNWKLGKSVYEYFAQKGSPL